MTAQITDAAAALTYLTAGKATVTLVSKKTGARFTYSLNANDDGDTLFVGLLRGPDNTSDYSYLGRIKFSLAGCRFWPGRKAPKPGDISPDAPSAKAFDWTWRALSQGILPETVEIWHEGRCGRCNRKLTVPSSIASGMGPECAGKSGLTTLRRDFIATEAK